MKIKCTADVCSVAHSFTVGKMYEIVKDEKGYKIINNQGVAWCNGRASEEIVLDELRRCYDFEVISDRHELHVTSDGTTTNAVYKLNGKVEKTAKAVCCPSDTFNFNVGAELALNRILYGTDYNPKDVAFKAESAPKQNEPKEPITLYCVKDSFGYTKGKIYKFENGDVRMDGQPFDEHYESLEDFRKQNPSISACLIRAEKRAAKLGEWVVIVDSYSPTGYKNGDVLQVKRVIGKSGIEVTKTDCCYLYNREYLVLPDYQPEKVEPEYYNGKVVCIDDGGARHFEVGKVYQFLGGRIFGMHGFYSSQYETLEKANSRNGVGAKFIEYKGEQS